jgi:taurine dioxygenase
MLPWREEPSLGSILRMIEGPQVGGDTLFSDMCMAYDGLSEDVKKKLEGAIAVHDFAGFRQRLIKKGKSEEESRGF